MFYLIRHGETDYSEKGTKIYTGFGENLLPLSLNGILQIKNTAQDTRLQNVDIIVSSPYTRALQTAAILSKELQVDITIETNLHEWVADKNYIFQDCEQGEIRCREFNEFFGEYPNNEIKLWEDNKALRMRLFSVLQKYSHYKKVIIVCHGMLIHSVYNRHWAENGEIIEYNMEG
jgi:broad specificity phosphatase PhoE